MNSQRASESARSDMSSWSESHPEEIPDASAAYPQPPAAEQPSLSSSAWSRRRGWLGGMAVGICFSGALLVAYLLGYHRSEPGLDGMLAETLVRAAASHSGDTMAIATGVVDEQEGLFVLDYLTGELQCYILNPRGPTIFFAVFRTNVINALGVEQGKKPSYAMVTGAVDFLRGAAIARPAGSVVYVCDTNTGNIAAYGIPWNRTAAAAGRPQQGALILLDVAKARNPDIIE